jgi:hypothetical protein
MSNDYARIKPQLDHDLPPIKNHTLAQWNAKFRAFNDGCDYVARDRFALTGRYTSKQDDREYRAGFEASAFRLTTGMSMSSVCDIDSVIGVLRGPVFPIASHANFHFQMLPSVKHTLTSNLHLAPIRVTDDDGEEIVSLTICSTTILENYSY